MTFIERITNDTGLSASARKLSARDLYAVARHVRGPYVGIIAALLKDPHGCRFCDYGQLRTPGNVAKGHDEDCPYLLAAGLGIEAAK